MSLRRPTVALLLFTFNISPLCDVASDIRLWHALSFIIHYKPFMWCRPDARLWHYHSAFSARGVFQTLAWHPVFHWDFRRTTARLPFYLSCSTKILLSECALLICSCASCLHLLYLMSKLSCEYFHSTHLAC